MFRVLIAALVLALGAPCPALAGDTTLATQPQTVLVGAQLGPSQFHVGAGVIIRANGSLTIVTAAHVVRDAKSITIQTYAGTKLDVVGSTVFIPGHDLALLRTALPEDGLHVATPDDTVVDNAPLYVWGHPHSKPFVLSEARFLTDKIKDGPGLFAITCPSCAVGDSGGGVFDQRGHLLGIVSQSVADVGSITGIVIAEPIGPALTAAGVALNR
jgi:S1-C subfamily serine protease